ncbi:MAG TPA: hypothetical protein VIV11_21775 [Kofleriaceae bacterium]
MVEGRVRGFSIATKCATVAELVEKFRDRVDEESILVNPVEQREVGTECAFAILLADRKPALAGTCVILDVFADANNPFKRPGMRLGIKRLGPDSQKVFAELVAKRIAPRKMTQALPIAMPRVSTQSIPPAKPGALADGSQTMTPVKPVIVMPRAVKPNTEAPRARIPEVVTPIALSRQLTQPIRGVRTEARGESPAVEVAREAPRRLPTVQIPPVLDELPLDEPLARAPRATPFELENVVKLEAKIVADIEAEAEPVTVPEAPRRARVETRTPGSPFVLPANPFTDLTDANLEGLVDCRLFETPPDGTPVIARRQRSEPLPLPPPPTLALPVPARRTPLPYAATKLPDLNVPDANDNVRPPRLARRVRNRLLALVLVPLLGAGAVAGYMQLTVPAGVALPLAPAATAVIDETDAATASMEPAPAAPAVVEPPAPVKPARMHAVFVQSYPIAARVTVGGLYFGTTPTYIKIPAHTPVEVNIQRYGFKPVVRPLTSKRPTDRVFVKLQRTRGRR